MGSHPANRFAEWIRQLAIPTAAQVSDRRLRLDPTATFLTFNYTDALQRLYGVPDQRILYIHGDARSVDPLVLGHAWEPQPNLDPYRIAANPEDADIREVEGQGLIDAYFADTFKPSKRIIAEEADFFRHLGAIKRVLVMGHSISLVDHPYFAEVLAHVPPQASWKISYYGDLIALQNRMEPLGIGSARVEFASLADF